MRNKSPKPWEARVLTDMLWMHGRSLNGPKRVPCDRKNRCWEGNYALSSHMGCAAPYLTQCTISEGIKEGCQPILALSRPHAPRTSTEHGAPKKIMVATFSLLAFDMTNLSKQQDLPSHSSSLWEHKLQLCWSRNDTKQSLQILSQP